MSANKHEKIEGVGASGAVGDNLIQVFEVWQNQRFYPISGWSSGLLPTDRASFSTHDGAIGFKKLEHVKGSQGWIWCSGTKWEVDKAKGDKDGWVYAVDFVGPMSSWTAKSGGCFVRRRRLIRTEQKPAVTSSKVNRVGAALAQRDALIGPYGRPRDKLVLRATSCHFSTDETERRLFDIGFSWCDPVAAQARAAGKAGKSTVIKIGKQQIEPPVAVTVKLPAAGLEVLPEPVNRQDPSWEDTFDVKVEGDKVTVWRIDKAGRPGWGQDLQLMAKEATPLEDELKDMKWSVTRTWEDFKWLYDTLCAAKRKPASLPTSGVGNFLMNKLGSVKAANDDGQFLERELPKWLNAALTDEKTREDPLLKLFIFHPNPSELRPLGATPKKGAAVGLSPELAVEVAMITATKTMDGWLEYCFEATMLELCTGGAVGKTKLQRVANTQKRRANQAARADQVGQMKAGLVDRPPGNEARTVAHKDRHGREVERLTLQQSSRFVIAIDRHQDEARLLEDRAAEQAARAAFSECCAALDLFEQHVQAEQIQWQAAVEQVQSEKTRFHNGVHVWVLNTMKAEFAPPFDMLEVGAFPPELPAHVEGQPLLTHGHGTFVEAGRKLAAQRSCMGAFVDDTVDTVELEAEKQQHDAERGYVFPELHTLIEAEKVRWVAEDEAFAVEAEIRTTERKLYNDKVTAQEGPLLAAMSSQKARLDDEAAHLARSPERDAHRKYHMDTAVQMMAQGVARHPEREVRNQHRDQIYAVAAQRQQAQAQNAERLFFPDDLAPVPVPDGPKSFTGDMQLLATMKGVNDADLQDLANGRVLCKDYARDRLAAVDTVAAWRRYEAEALGAQAPEPVVHFDRAFLQRLAGHASAFDTANAEEEARLATMTSTLAQEHAQVDFATPPVSAKLAETEAQLLAEAPYDADERARNEAIAAAVSGERAARMTKESTLSTELARVNGIVTSERQRLDQAQSTFSSALGDTDVQLFLALEKPTWMGGLGGRLDSALLESVSECKRLTHQSNRRRDMMQNGGGPGSLHEGRDGLKRIRHRNREVRTQLDKSKRGEERLRRATASAQKDYDLAMRAMAQCPIYTSEPGHPADAWLAHHIQAQAAYAAQHQGLHQVASQLQSELTSYSVANMISGLVSLFDGGSRLVRELDEATKHLEHALGEEERRRREVEQSRQQQAPGQQPAGGEGRGRGGHHGGHRGGHHHHHSTSQ